MLVLRRQTVLVPIRCRQDSSIRVHVGLATARDPLVPIRPMPTVVSKDDAMDYADLVATVIRSLQDDALRKTVYRNPGKLRADAQNKINDAEEIDGCENGILCKPGDEKKFTSPNNQVVAAALRKQASGLLLSADEMDERAKSRGLKNDAAGNAQVLKEIALYGAIEKLKDRVVAKWTALNEATTAWGSDWSEVQALDLDVQKMRNRYRVETGFEPSMALPSAPPAASGGIPWGWIIVAGVLVGGALLLGQVRGLFGASGAAGAAA